MKAFAHGIFAIALVAPVLGACAAQAPARSESAAVAALLADVQTNAPYVGLAVSVRRGEEVIYEGGLGLADLENQVAATPETIFQIGSITKSFTSILIAQLAVEGRIDLDAPVSTYLPDYRGPARSAPVRTLMNHTSGLVNYTNAPNFPHGTRRDFTRAEMLAFFENEPLMFEPGTAFSYSNSGTYLLGLIVEAVTGQDYSTVVHDRIFVPLGLEHTYYGAWEQIIPHRAHGYVRTDGGFANAPELDDLIPFSAGALDSNVRDIQRYLDQVHRQNVLGDEVRNILYTQANLGDGSTLDYAQGAILIRNWEGHRKIAHAGDIDGFSAYMSYYPDDDISIVVLANTRDVTPTPVGIEQKIARLIFAIPHPAPSAAPLQANEVAALTGDYQAGALRVGIDVVGIVATETGIAFRIGGANAEGPAIPLIHLDGRRFSAAHDDEMIFSFGPEGAAATNLSIDWLGGSIPFHRPPPR
ncbi:MAG: beta-lactamase family protein [Hyphomonadaceae bacterium JAD_PAG50586_4]|nr:MAG: beta-lactamase family protein [Hyphomonadaceae bacterium JAD_PAG50586_4]